MAVPLTVAKPRSIGISLFSWIVVLLMSDLPNAAWQALIGEPPSWLFWVKVGLLLALILTSIAWRPIQATRSFFILLLVLMLALKGMNMIMATAAYDQWQNRVGWVMAMTGFEALKMTVTLVMIIALLLMGRQSKDFFLTWGQAGLPVRAVKGEGSARGRQLSWGWLSIILGVCIAPLTLLFFGMSGFPTAAILLKALPYFPAALLFAAANAFSEEVQYRAALLPDLQKNIGADQAIWLSAAFFGFAHYFGGSPSGIVGVLIAGLLGALFAKFMLTTKGISTPWFIHFCQNAIIFAFGAIGAMS